MQLRQTSFAAGELSPLLHGRVDLDLFNEAVRTLKNFLVMPTGAAATRTGFRKGWQVTAGNCVLVPMLHPSGESYVLELSHLQAKLFNARTMLQVGATIATVFQETDLEQLHWAQFGTLVLFTHRLRPPQELTFTAAGISIQAARYGPPGETSTDPPLTAVMPPLDGRPPAYPALVSWQPGTLFVNGAEPWREWRYKVSTIVRNRTTGQVVETLAVDITQYVEGDALSGNYGPRAGLPGPITLPGDGRLVLSSAAPIYIAPGEGAPGGSSTNWEPIEYLYYRGRGSVFGLIGSSTNSGLFADFGEEPNYAIPPLRGESPFATGEYPRTCAFFAARRAFAGSPARTSTFWLSAVSAFGNYDKPVVSWNGQPLEGTIADRSRESILGLAQSEFLCLLTDTSVWALGRSDAALDYDTLPSLLRKVDSEGARPLRPLDVEGTILYASRGRGVRGVRAAEGREQLQSADLSWQAEHMFRGSTSLEPNRRIVSWCYQREPWSTIWLVMSDGELLSCSRTAQGRYAWARHNVGGRVLSCCAVPSVASADGVGDVDHLFLAVLRTASGFSGISGLPQDRVWVERMTPRFDPLGTVGTEQYTYPLDSYIVAQVDPSVDTVVSGLGHLQSREVWASCPGIEPVGPFTVSVSGTITIPAGWGPQPSSGQFYAAVGLAYTCDLGLLDAAKARMGEMNVTRVAVEVHDSQGFEVGIDESNLSPWRQRNVSNSYGFPGPSSELVDLRVNGRWDRLGRGFIRQAKPLPLTVISVMRELEKGGT